MKEKKKKGIGKKKRPKKQERERELRGGGGGGGALKNESERMALQKYQKKAEKAYNRREMRRKHEGKAYDENKLEIFEDDANLFYSHLIWR